jgi:hypothetical protein
MDHLFFATGPMFWHRLPWPLQMLPASVEYAPAHIWHTKSISFANSNSLFTQQTATISLRKDETKQGKWLGQQHNPPEQLIYMCFEGLALWFLGSPGVLLTPSSCAITCARATNSTTRLCVALPHPSPAENKIAQLWVFLKLHACSTWIWLLTSDPTTSWLDSWRQPGAEHGKVLIPGQILVQSWECACEEKQSAIAASFQ